MDLISKYDLIEKIVNTDNEIILHQVKHILEEEETESWDKLNPKLKASINRGLSQADKGQLLSHAAIMKGIKKKYAR